MEHVKVEGRSEPNQGQIVEQETTSHPKHPTEARSTFQSVLERGDHERSDTETQPPFLAGEIIAPMGSSISGPGTLDRLQLTMEASRAPLITPRSVPTVDAALAQTARDVQLASNGRDHYVLSFEVASGELQGSRIAVTSASGVVSAVAVPTSVEAALRLEHAFEEARLSLEARGIDISGMEVRTGVDDGCGSRFEEQEHRAPEEIRMEAPRRAARSDATPTVGHGVDYLV